MTVPSDARVTLITGASRGLGAFLAEHLLAQGDVVFGCARGEAALVHDRYTHLQADVTDEEQVRQLFRSIRAQAGRLDVLINNAGTASMNPIALMPVASARKLLKLNFLATFMLTQAAFRLLRSSKAGRVVNVSTVAVPLQLEGEAVYAATKSAVETFTKIAAKEFGKFNITCNAVGPSPIQTRLLENVPQVKLNKLIAEQAIPRWAEPADVANVVDFFLRPESGMITGQVVYLGGAGR